MYPGWHLVCVSFSLFLFPEICIFLSRRYEGTFSPFLYLVWVVCRYPKKFLSQRVPWKRRCCFFVSGMGFLTVQSGCDMFSLLVFFLRCIGGYLVLRSFSFCVYLFSSIPISVALQFRSGFYYFTCLRLLPAFVKELFGNER